MKSPDVKTQKQNYLVFSSNTTFIRIIRRNLPGGILPGSLVSYICLSRYHIARAELTSPKHLTDISWA
jgi:hypothetical protein